MFFTDLELTLHSKNKKSVLFESDEESEDNVPEASPQQSASDDDEFANADEQDELELEDVDEDEYSDVDEEGSAPQIFDDSDEDESEEELEIEKKSKKLELKQQRIQKESEAELKTNIKQSEELLARILYNCFFFIFIIHN